MLRVKILAIKFSLWIFIELTLKINETLLEINFIEKIKTSLGNKECSKLCFVISVIRENRFFPFDSVPLATLRFKILFLILREILNTASQTFVKLEKNNFEKFLAK